MCDTMVSRILALLVWAAVAASVAYWGLRWFSRPMAVPPGTGSVSMSSTPRGDIGKLLTAPMSAEEAEQANPTAQSALAARLQLLGVLAPRAGESGPGVALLVVDGKPAQAFKIGHVVDGDQIVQSISQQGVQIGPQGGPASVDLSLPLLPPAATGTLPSVSSFSGAPSHQANRPAGTYGAAAQAPSPVATDVEGTPAGERPRRLPPRLRRQQMQPQQPPGGAPEQTESAATSM